jgi:hypothetical protein
MVVRATVPYEPYDYAKHGAEMSTDEWDAVNSDNFASIFVRGKSKEDEDKGFFLSPRMALKLFCSATELANILSDSRNVYGTIDHPLFGSSVHPKVCEKFFRQVRWVDAYVECYRRIASRLAKVEFLDRLAPMYDYLD